MVQLLSKYLNAKPRDLKRLGVFDGYLGIDNRLFVDPRLVESSNAPEFQDARQELVGHFSKVIKLLGASKQRGDIAWKAALNLLLFPEEHGVFLGYAGAGQAGRGIGPDRAQQLEERGKEIVDLGITDPEMFELIPLFEEHIGPDLLSDAAISILKCRFLEFTQRVTRSLGIKAERFSISQREWSLPASPEAGHALVLIPEAMLNTLPIAMDRSEISEVAKFNAEVRLQWNAIVTAAGRKNRKPSKPEIRHLLLNDPKNLQDLISVYKRAGAAGYDFNKDPDGLLSWDFAGRVAAQQFPLQIQIKKPANIEELRAVVHAVVRQFKKNVEENKLYSFLYRPDGSPHHEVYAQRLFFAVADAYCAANDVALSREPNAGNGPVDFKLSVGYKEQILVEVKKSNNSSLIHGFESQLPEYEKSEATFESIYIIVRINEGENAYKSLSALRQKKLDQGLKVPEIFYIDGRPKKSASKI
jgi:hypothetical protein